MHDFEQIEIEDDVERLLLIRKRLRKGQHEFARELNVTSIYLSKVENYKTPFTSQLKVKVQNYLHKLNEVQNL